MICKFYKLSFFNVSIFVISLRSFKIFVYWQEKEDSILFIVLAEIRFILESLDAVTQKVHFTADIQYEIKY